MIYQLTSQFTRDSKNDVSLSRVSTSMNYYNCETPLKHFSE